MHPVGRLLFSQTHAANSFSVDAAVHSLLTRIVNAVKRIITALRQCLGITEPVPHELRWRVPGQPVDPRAIIIQRGGRNRQLARARLVDANMQILPDQGVDPRFPGIVINRASLSRTPQPFDFETYRVRFESQVPDIGELVDFVDRCFAQETEARKEERKNALRGYVEFIRTRNHGENRFYARGGQLDLYYDSMALLTKGIIFQLRKSDEEISLDKKQAALGGIEDAFLHCMPRRYEETRQHFYHLLPGGTVEEKLLRYFQIFKEQIFLEEFQEEQFHILNHIRFELGLALGLDRSTLNQYDAQINAAARDQYSRLACVDCFNRNCRVGPIVSSMRSMINLSGEAADFGLYLQEYINQQGIRDENGAEIDVGTRYYRFFGRDNPENGLTEEGVVLILRRLGLFSDQLPE